MKRILILFAFIALVASVNAQWNRLVGYALYTGQAADTAISGTAASVVWAANQPGMYLYQIEADIDEISGSVNGIVKLYGSNDRSHYYLVDTLTTTLTTTGTEALSNDGTVGLSDLSTGMAWRFLKAELSISGTGKWDFNYIRFRAVGKND